MESSVLQCTHTTALRLIDVTLDTLLAATSHGNVSQIRNGAVKHQPVIPSLVASPTVLKMAFLSKMAMYSEALLLMDVYLGMTYKEQQNALVKQMVPGPVLLPDVQRWNAVPLQSSRMVSKVQVACTSRTLLLTPVK
jgi:hypothetical protein